MSLGELISTKFLEAMPRCLRSLQPDSSKDRKIIPAMPLSFSFMDVLFSQSNPAWLGVQRRDRSMLAGR